MLDNLPYIPAMGSPPPPPPMDPEPWLDAVDLMLDEDSLGIVPADLR